MKIKKLSAGDLADFRTLIGIFKEVFENNEPIASDEQLNKLLANPDFIVFVITVNDHVVGGLTLYVLHRYLSTKPVAYIYDVGVRPDYQHQGLGKALIAEVCSFCQQQGFEDAYVEAESEDTDAVHFYRKTKFSSEMHAVHFTYSFANERES